MGLLDKIGGAPEPKKPVGLGLLVSEPKEAPEGEEGEMLDDSASDAAADALFSAVEEGDRDSFKSALKMYVDAALGK